MQIDVFALLTEARQRIAAHIAAVEAKKDFWLASTDLDDALIGGGGARDRAARATANRAGAAAGE